MDRRQGMGIDGFLSGSQKDKARLDFHIVAAEAVAAKFPDATVRFAVHDGETPTFYSRAAHEVADRFDPVKQELYVALLVSHSDDAPPCEVRVYSSRPVAVAAGFELFYAEKGGTLAGALRSTTADLEASKPTKATVSGTVASA